MAVPQAAEVNCGHCLRMYMFVYMNFPPPAFQLCPRSCFTLSSMENIWLFLTERVSRILSVFKPHLVESQWDSQNQDLITLITAMCTAFHECTYYDIIMGYLVRKKINERQTTNKHIT